MNKKLIGVLGTALAVLSLASCKKVKEQEEEATGTAAIVAKASKMSLAELEAASKAEMEASTDTFKVVGLTSVLQKAATTFQAKYTWVTADNTYVNNSYKDYALLNALEVAEDGYFADYALVQDVRSIADYDGDLLHNYVPSDWQAMGLSEEDTKQPLKGIAFNKLFWTNTNFTKVTGKTLHNIWQMTTSAKEAGKDYLDKVSFQNAATEQINMSFLLSCYADENQERIAEAYKSYFGTEWACPEGKTYANAGEQWVNEFVATISRWHSSDGTAMKETQLKDDWNEGYVYYGAFAKMKDAIGKYNVPTGVNVAEDAILSELVITEGENQGKINCIDTVKWDWEIEGFNGFYYNMCSQIVNNAKHPYTACLFARNLLTLDAYKGGVYNKDLPDETGVKFNSETKVNQYGYYFPASNDITYAYGDWDRDTHIKNELVENYSFLKSIRQSRVNEILAMIGNNGAAK